MTRTSTWIVALTFALALGCDPSMYDFRVFDDLVADTWVHSSGPPDGVGGADYGISLAGGGQGSSGARVFSSGRTDDGLAYLLYLPTGATLARVVPLSAINTLPEPNPLPLVPLLAGDRDGTLAALALTNGGTPEAPLQSTIALLDSSNGEPGELFALPGAQLVSGLAFGKTDAIGSGARSVVVARGDLLTLIADAASTAGAVYDCAHGATAAPSVVAADLGASPEDEIALAVSGVAGEVRILTGSAVATAAGGPCGAPLLTLTAPGGEADFGRQMLAADLDGSGLADLVVSGGTTVYVYLDVSAVAGVPEPIAIPAPGGTVSFGSALAAGDLDGDGADELAVGAPDGVVEDKGAAGAVYLYQLGDGVPGEPVMLADAQPEDEQRFGRTVAIVPMGTDRGMLVVGARDEVFAYFRTPISDDLRTGL